MDRWAKAGVIAQIVLAVLTLVLAVIAVFQDPIRDWVRRPRLLLSAVCEPPDCVAIPIINFLTKGTADAMFLRVNVSNKGNTAARYVEVFARDLRRKRADSKWERVTTFPPMNLKWSNLGGAIYVERIAPGMSKQCDIAHITAPTERGKIYEGVPPGVAPERTALSFELQVLPNHLGHVVGPGDYRLDLIVAAENADPQTYTAEISLKGEWFKDEARMARDGVGIRILD